METTVWVNEIKVEVWCVGHFTMETRGYYAGFASVDNFQVYDGNDNVTAQLDEDTIEELKTRYLNMCLSEECA